MSPLPPPPPPLQDDWSQEQQSALHEAYFRVAPTHPFYWQEVAKTVPGRTAGVGPDVWGYLAVQQVWLMCWKCRAGETDCIPEPLAFCNLSTV